MVEFCGHEWQALTTTRSHRCELRPDHRGSHVCACGVRSVTTEAARAELAAPDQVVDYSVPTAARRFILDRASDPSGVSGLGIVAEGVEFTDGAVALRWLGQWPSTTAWGSVEAVLAVHGHNGLTKLRWVDEVDEP